MTRPPSEIEALTEAATELVTRIDQLSRSSGTTIVDLATATRRNRRLIWLVAAGSTLDVLLTVAMAFAGAGIADNNERVDKVTARLDDTQTVQRAKALCPLYRVFLDSERFTPPNQSPEQAASRVAAFRTIREGYAVLHCEKVTR